MRRVAGVLLVLLACVAIWYHRTPLSPSEVVVSLTGPTMGTTYTIRLFELPVALTSQQLQQQVAARLVELNEQMSTYLPDSELSRFNRDGSEDWFGVSSDFAQVVSAALEVSRMSGGAFDVTVGPLVNLWNFGPDLRPRGIPGEHEIEAGLARVGYTHLDVRLDPPAIRKRKGSIQIDLSAIAKGYAVDAVAGLLDERGIERYMVEIGGEVRTRGRKRDGSPWHIGVEEPVAGDRRVHCIVQLVDRALATSGDYRNFFTWEGRTYSHAIDPRTGWPVAHGVASVAVLSDSAMWADAWATALMVMEPEPAWELAQRAGLEVLMLVRTPEGLAERLTTGFSQAISQSTPSGAMR